MNGIHDEKFILGFVAIRTVKLLNWKVALFAYHCVGKNWLWTNNKRLINKLPWCQSKITIICNLKTFWKLANNWNFFLKISPLDKNLLSSRVRNVWFWVDVFDRVLFKILKYEFFHFVSSKIDSYNNLHVFSIKYVWRRASDQRIIYKSGTFKI